MRDNTDNLLLVGPRGAFLRCLFKVCSMCACLCLLISLCVSFYLYLVPPFSYMLVNTGTHPSPVNVHISSQRHNHRHNCLFFLFLVQLKNKENNTCVLHMGNKVYFEVTFEKKVSAMSYFFSNTSENIAV